MSMLEGAAFAVVVAVAVYLIALGAASLFLPAKASQFLLGLASTRSLHFMELSLRLIAGAALVLHAPRMALPGTFSLFGWVLLVTTACLLAVPWQWHRAFAQRAVPLFTRYIALVGLVSLALGCLVIGALVRRNAA